MINIDWLKKKTVIYKFKDVRDKKNLDETLVISLQDNAKGNKELEENAK